MLTVVRARARLALSSSIFSISAAPIMSLPLPHLAVVSIDCGALHPIKGSGNQRLRSLLWYCDSLQHLLSLCQSTLPHRNASCHKSMRLRVDRVVEFSSLRSMCDLPATHPRRGLLAVSGAAQFSRLDVDRHHITLELIQRGKTGGFCMDNTRHALAGLLCLFGRCCFYRGYRVHDLFMRDYRHRAVPTVIA